MPTSPGVGPGSNSASTGIISGHQKVSAPNYFSTPINPGQGVRAPIWSAAADANFPPGSLLARNRDGQREIAPDFGAGRERSSLARAGVRVRGFLLLRD
jgi:hypothetical protein